MAQSRPPDIRVSICALLTMAEATTQVRPRTLVRGPPPPPRFLPVPTAAPQAPSFPGHTDEEQALADYDP